MTSLLGHSSSSCGIVTTQCKTQTQEFPPLLLLSAAHCGSQTMLVTRGVHPAYAPQRSVKRMTGRVDTRVYNYSLSAAALFTIPPFSLTPFYPKGLAVISCLDACHECVGVDAGASCTGMCLQVDRSRRRGFQTKNALDAIQAC